MAFLKARTIAALLAAALSLGAGAASPQKEKIFQFALQNGMQVVVIPDHRAPVITQMLWYRVGAMDDPPGIGGVARFLRPMMFCGTAAPPRRSVYTTRSPHR